MNPYSGPGQIFRLTPGKVYTWKFQVAAQGNVDTLLWQIHVYNAGQNGCGTSPGAGLSVGKHNGQMMWDLWDLGPDTYFPGFVPNQPASWTVVAKISQGSDGYTSYYLNGKRLFTYHKQNVPSPPCDASPFWNYGPYVPTWIYTLPSGLSTEDDYGYMKLYTQ
jgi:hypothetical protein